MARIDASGRILCGESTDELPALLIDALEEFVLQNDRSESSHRLDAMRNLFYEWEDIAQDDAASTSWINEHCRMDGTLAIERLGSSFLPIPDQEAAPNDTDIVLPMNFLNHIVEQVLASTFPDRYCRINGALEMVNEWTELAANEERLAGHLLLTHEIEDVSVLKGGGDLMFTMHSDLHAATRRTLRMLGN